MVALYHIIAIIIASCSAVTSQIIKPCPLNNYACIRNTMAANSICNPQVYGMPSQYTIPEFPFQAPYFNSTYIDYDLTISNHNKCKVSEFFYDSATDVVVISIDCPSIVFQSTRLRIQHATYKEDKYYSYAYKATYPLIRLTMNIRNAGNLNICESFTFTDITVLPKVQAPLTPQTSSPVIFEKEQFANRGSLLMRYYINSYLCNFGCDF